MGGLHRFMAWPGGILTDSGGYQVFSLADLRKISEEGVRFRSHLDGTEHMLTPEKAIQVQRALGSDIGMVLDECIEYPAAHDRAAAAARRTLEWAKRSQERDRGERRRAKRIRSRFSSPSCRAGRMRICAAKMRRSWWRWIFRATRSAGWRWASRTGCPARSPARRRRACRKTGRDT